MIRIPGGTGWVGSLEDGDDRPPREMQFASFLLGEREVKLNDWCRWLNTGARGSPDDCPPGVTRHGRRFRPLRGLAEFPVTHVSYETAHAYCAWLSEQTGLQVRLPTEDEWEYAARGGIRGAPYPWGWGAPAGRCNFAADGVQRTGGYAPNGYGLRDMAGNVFEWCARSRETPGVDAPARGGSWAERDEYMVRVYARARFPADYRDADVGFRILVEDRSGDTVAGLSGAPR
jgi:formylglycine-generating enzyme required for sulfatase activity